MMRTILRALRAVLRALGRLAAMPGKFIGAMLGGGCDVEIIDDDDGMPAPGAAAEKTVDDADPLAAYRENLEIDRQAAAICSYAANAEIDGMRPTPSLCLSRIQKEWLGGLSMSELRMISDHGREAIAKHIAKGPYVQGLYRVVVLPAKTLVPLAPRDYNGELTTWKLSATLPSVSLH